MIKVVVQSCTCLPSWSLLAIPIFIIKIMRINSTNISVRNYPLRTLEMTFQSIEICSNFKLGKNAPNLCCAGSCLQHWRDSQVIKKLKKPYIFYLLILSTFNYVIFVSIRMQSCVAKIVQEHCIDTAT